MDKREAPPIGRDEVLQAAQTLREYKNGKSALERRICLLYTSPSPRDA